MEYQPSASEGFPIIMHNLGHQNEERKMKYHTRRRFASIARVLDIIRRVVLGFIFWGVLITLLVLLLFSHRPPAIKKGSLLLIQPEGYLMDAYTEPMNYRGIPILVDRAETLLDDLVSALDHATTDTRIVGAWLRLDDFIGGGTASAGELAEAVARFRDSGKTIIASADSFDNERYRIASPASRIVIDRLGAVFPTGFGTWRPYYAEGLEKLGAEVHLFRSGESKTSAENFIFSEMSEAARRDERRLQEDLWSTWIDETAKYRGIESAQLADWVNRYDEHLMASDSDASKAALDAGLVDLVENGNVFEEVLEESFGDAADRQVDALEYVQRITLRERAVPIIAVIPIVGELAYGEGAPGFAGSQDIADAIHNAREHPDVKALVLRIDSSGGDVRAAEEVRRVLEETRKDWEIPVVVSMGNLTASGGYWIAVESDLIITRPDTITGSIGVFSLSFSFEKALAQWLGIRIDGLGTTPWSGAFHPGRTLDERAASLYEAGVSDVNKLFHNLVSEKRGISSEELMPLTAGIPWSGRRALKHGLADRLGGLADARIAAAELAGVKQWKSLHFEKEIDPMTAFLKRLFQAKHVRSASKAVK